MLNSFSVRWLRWYISRDTDLLERFTTIIGSLLFGGFTSSYFPVQQNFKPVCSLQDYLLSLPQEPLPGAQLILVDQLLSLIALRLYHQCAIDLVSLQHLVDKFINLQEFLVMRISYALES